jgi:hypothetical protein
MIEAYEAFYCDVVDGPRQDHSAAKPAEPICVA